MGVVGVLMRKQQARGGWDVGQCPAAAAAPVCPNKCLCRAAAGDCRGAHLLEGWPNSTTMALPAAKEGRGEQMRHTTG